MLTPIEQNRLTDIVYARLRKNILQRQFAAGERLRVDELAAQLSVSRTPVREALNLLASEGLVEIVPRSGTFVSHLTAKDLEEVYDLRICLEGLAAERVAERGLSKEELSHLRGILEQSRAGRTAQEGELRHAEANRAFHEAIVELSGNRRLAQLYSAVNGHSMMAAVHYASPAWLARWGLELEEHERIVAALEAGDPTASRKAMEAHLRRGRDSLLADLKAAGDGNGDRARAAGEGKASR